ncbi:putative Phenol 2-monooxygenase [Glarea lozoyensis 74030]|uniref:Putative Phenol 2-monooxygenase n=1 Tax=Glarea lozoyensis (strain ATCC 74030 / MF5533) TaxID=1104152 RepID=H0EMJ6_GLAL7|nr:putative Phenol 2-monooxygenase [Glarea lozoyensis 74030]
MDTYPLTNFPDIRKKSVIHSAHGVLMIIPREGGSLARFYIELHSSTVPKSVTLAQLQESARKIFNPYELEFADTYWWSAYSIGQRLAERFHEQERVFLAGDACHTHSPKAGQGMNTSLQDGYNIGWKLGQLLSGRASASLLSTYLLERQKIAKTLIDFDRVWAKQIAAGKSVGDDGKEVDFSETFNNAEKLERLGEYLYSTPISLISKFTKPEEDIDSFIETIVILSGNRTETQQDQIPPCFMPVSGKYRMRDIHKIYIDDESYNYGHGHAYEFYGIDPDKGAIVIVRPDHLDVKIDGGAKGFKFNMILRE